MNTIKTPLARRLALLLLAVVFIPGLAAAQEDSERDSETGKRTVIIIDENGRMTVNGEEVETLPPATRDALLFRNRVNWAPRLADFNIGLDLPVYGRLLGLDDLENRIEIQVGTQAEIQEIMRLERESRQMARDLRRAEGDERRRLERDLRERLNTLFDKKLEIREKRVQALEGELEKQREQIDKRQESRNDIIERRYRDLTGQDNDLDW